MYKLFAGADIGNDSLKMFVNGFEEQLTIPNVTQEIDTRKVIKYEANILDGLHVRIESEALAKTIGSYAVGALAARSKLKYEPQPNDFKGVSDQPVILLLTSLAYEAALKFPGDKVSVTVYLATGLPMREGKSRENRLAFKNKLKNVTHTVTFLQTPRFEGREVEIKFEEVLVSTEGFAVYLDLIQDEDGYDRNEELMDATVAIHDLGGLTSDTAVLEEGNIIEEHCTPLDAGVSSFLDDIIKDVFTEKHYKIKSRKELVKIITTKNADKRYMITHESGPVSIQNIVDRHFTDLAKMVYRHIQSIWQLSPGIEYCYVTGGGALILKSYLTAINNENRKYNLRFLNEMDSVWAIARAYTKMLKDWAEENAIELPVASLVVEE